MTVLQLTERLGLTEADMKMCEDIDWNEQRAATSGQGIMRIFVCCEGILKEKKRSLSRQISMLDFSTHLLGLLHRHLYFWTLEMLIQLTRLQLKREYLFVVLFSILFK
jgi:hypothetical protein